MAGKNTALKAGLGYTIGNVLVKGINFLTLPLFSRLLTTAEFGVYNVFLSYDAILSVLIGLALHSSIKSAHYEFKKNRRVCILNKPYLYFKLYILSGHYFYGRSETVVMDGIQRTGASIACPI